MKRRTTLLLGAGLVALSMLSSLATAVPATALETHPFTGVTIGPEGKAAPGRFANPASVAVDPSTGGIYVLATSSGEGRLYKFDSEGEPEAFTATPGQNFIEGVGGWSQDATFNQVAVAPTGAVGGTAGDIYVANSKEVKIYSPAGIEIGHLTSSLNDLCGVAVDGTGNVFTMTRHTPFLVTRYTPAANPPTNADESGRAAEPLENSCNIAVDGNGRIYGSSSASTPLKGETRLWKLESLSAEETELFDLHSSTVAIEPGTNNVYVSHGTEIAEYTEDGIPISKFGEDRLAEAPGVAIGREGGEVYVAARTSDGQAPAIYKGRIDVYGPLATLPKALARPADSLTKTSAVLHGTISADGGPQATCEFQYATEAAYEEEGFEGAPSAPCSPGGPFSGNTAEAVSAEITGLAVGAKYRYRLVGENENGALGSDENGTEPKGPASFETLPAFAVKSGPATEVGESSATLTGSINPEGLAITGCFFEYGATDAYGAEAPCEAPDAGEIGSGNAPVAVHAHINGLSPSTEYHYRLVGASSAFGGIEAHGADAAFGTQGPPEIVSEAFSGVGQTSATISGQINPHSSPTTYYVEYVTRAAYEESGFSAATRVPAAGAVIGEGFEAVEVSQALTGLAPGAEYAFRLYAENGLGKSEGKDRIFRTKGSEPVLPLCPANEAFRVEASALLPDCRAYEQVSSPNKNGDSAAGLYSQMFTAEDGSAATFYSPAGTLPPAEGGGAQNYATYLARRSAGAWSSQRLLPPEQYGSFAEYLGSTPDLRYAVVEAGISEVETGLFLIDTESDTVTQIAPYEQFSEKGINQFGFDGASADGSRVFFESKAAIPTTPASPAPAPGHHNLYVWERSTGEVSLAGVLPAGEGGEAPAGGSFGGAHEWYSEENLNTGGALNQPGNASEPLAVAGLHAISPDGDQIFFTAAGTGQLYLRRGLGGGEPATVRISAPNRGISSPERPAAFQEATPGGSRAFFLSRQKLTVDATTGAKEERTDLYRWDASAPAGKSLADVAPDSEDPNGAEVQGLLGAAPDGSSGYFVARGVLGDAAEKGVEGPGGENLYRFSEEGAGKFAITYIATLAAGMEQAPDRRNVSPKVSLFYPLGKTSRVSADGETLLFASKNPLTGYDNTNPEGIACEAGACPELYLYSAASAKLSCVSCDPTGEAPLGAASLQDVFFNAYFTPTLPPAVSFSRNLSADGSRVFFQTPDPLVAADSNGEEGCPASGTVYKEGEFTNRSGTGRCQDVYEWEAVGSGSCQVEEANGGCLYLLSTGKSERPSYFVGASKDGSSAFIATTSRLVPADRDQAADVYDAREGGGLASQHEIAPEPCGSAGACRGPATAPPPAASPASSSLQIAGNPKPGPRPKPCKKGKVRRHGRCVPRSKHHKHKQKRHHKGNLRTMGKKRPGGRR